MTTYSVAWRAETEQIARRHLLQHYNAGHIQEDIALATWFPASGANRYTAVIDEVLLPTRDERVLQGNVRMTAEFLRRCRRRALSKGAGMAVMHNHLTPGWQGMSADDVVMEKRSVSNPARATGLPALGMTLGTDGTWSARFWLRMKSTYERQWCSTIRIVSPQHFDLQTFPDEIVRRDAAHESERFRRSLETWGLSGQQRVGELRVGIVGLGSVGALAAEAMGRIGVRRLVLVDMDRIEAHNLDRLIHAGPGDIGMHKVRLAEGNLKRFAPQSFDELVVLPLSLRESSAYRAIADCDIILGCADKPAARDLMNHLALCHLIPVVEAGVALRSKKGRLHKGHIVAQIVTPDSRCLRCTNQYTTDQLTLEVEGLLEDPEYISALPADRRPPTANIFPASLAAAAQQTEMFMRLVLGPRWWPPVYQQRYHLSVASKHKQTALCEDFCDVHARRCLGDRGDPDWLFLNSSKSASRSQ